MTAEEKARSKSRARREAEPPGQPPAAPGAAEQHGEAARWHEGAAFRVAFEYRDDAAGQRSWRTQAYHEETDERARWHGIADQALLRWMREKADLSGAAGAAPAADDMLLRIDDLRLAEALAEQQAGGPVLEKRLHAEVDFQLIGVGTYPLTARQPEYVVQLLAYDLDSRAMMPLALERGQLRPERLDYAAAADFDLPENGRYQVLATVMLPGEAAAAVTFGPLLEIVP